MAPGEEDGILFKTLYVTKLPSQVRSHMLVRGFKLISLMASWLMTYGFA